MSVFAPRIGGGMAKTTLNNTITMVSTEGVETSNLVVSTLHSMCNDIYQELKVHPLDNTHGEVSVAG